VQPDAVIRPGSRLDLEGVMDDVAEENFPRAERDLAELPLRRLALGRFAGFRLPLGQGASQAGGALRVDGSSRRLARRRVRGGGSLGGTAEQDDRDQECQVPQVPHANLLWSRSRTGCAHR